MLKKLLRLIMPLIPVESMLYKTCLVYKDPILQKDWISTMYRHINPKHHKTLESLVGPPVDQRTLAKEILGRSPNDSFEEQHPLDALKLRRVDSLYEIPSDSLTDTYEEAEEAMKLLEEGQSLASIQWDSSDAEDSVA